jgi:hypothetical protein
MPEGLSCETKWSRLVSLGSRCKPRLATKTPGSLPGGATGVLPGVNLTDNGYLNYSTGIIQIERFGPSYKFN